MTKISRLITLDYEINEKLKECDNASRLIEELLGNHFNAHLSNDIDFLIDQAKEIEIKIKGLEINRDSLSDRIRVLAERDKIRQEKTQAEEDIKIKEKTLRKFLSSKVKDKMITFDEFRNIGLLDNWEDCVEAVMAGELDLKELAEKATPKELEENQNI